MPRKRTVFLVCELCGSRFSVSPSRNAELHRGRYCTRACWRASRAWSKERFWNNVDKTGDCWLWMGQRSHFLYGVAYFRGRQQGAHRVAWTITYGEIPAGMYVCHHCDNPPCVRPEHLFVGDDLANSHDMMRKGRNMHKTHPETLARGERHWTHVHPEAIPRGQQNGARLHPERVPRGESVATSKLTTEQVQAIRARYAVGGVPQRQLAREFGLGQSQVQRILKGESWAHVG